MKYFGKIVDPKDMVTKEYVDKFLPLSGGHVTGPVTFGDSITVDEATIGDLVVNGNASFTNNIQANKINGVTVGNNPKFTDTLATATTTGSGNAITAVSATNGALTFTKGSTFLTGITSAMVTTALGYTPYNSTNPNGYTTNKGTVTSVRVQATSPVVSSSSAAQSTTLDTTISLANGYGDTKNPYGSKTAGTVLAAPSSADGAPSFRTIAERDIKPLDSRSYTNVIGSASSWAGTSFGYASVKPDNYYKPWRVRIRITMEAAGSDLSHASSVLTLDGVQDTYVSYAAQNVIQYSSNRPAYYHMYYRFKQAAIEADGSHYIGFSLLYSWNYTTAANSRTVKVELLDYENCEVQLLDNLLAYNDISSKSNFYTYTTFDFASSGLQETGDANDGNYYHRLYYTSRKAAQAIYRYQFVLSKIDGSLIPFSTTDNSTATTKVMNTTSFDPFGAIYWYYSSGTTAAGNNFSNSVLYDQYLSDWTYSFNVAKGGFTAREPVYIVATPQSDGTAVLTSPYVTQTLPATDDGLIYIYLGQVYEDSSTYRIYHYWYHPVYWYKNGGIKLFSRTATSVPWSGVSGKPTTTQSATTGISISDHNTGSIIGVQSTTTTASKVTFGPVISIPNVTSVGSASNWVFEDITVPKAASSTACDDITSWSAGSGSASLTMTMDTTDTKKLIISFSHTHTAPTLNYTARSITGVSGSTTASHVKSGGNGSAPTLGTAISVPNVTGASDVTVPIKNASSTTVVTGNKHTITDSGHSHSI